jgi:hypothetical protein
MGIYTSNRYFSEAYDYASEIPANKAYDAAFGCAHILADCQTNDMALFESTIYSDFAEVRAVQEGYGYVNENAFTNVIKKIVETFQKILAKIKGIFASFLTKMTSAFKDNKKLVEQYAKQIDKCPSWKGFKVKGIRVPKNDDIVDVIDKIFANNEETTKKIYKITSNDKLFGVGWFKNKPVNEIIDEDSENIKNELLNIYCKGYTDTKEFHNNLTDNIYNEETTISEENDRIDASYFSKPWIKSVLINGKDTEKRIKKYNEKLEGNINQIIANLNTYNDFLIDSISNGNTSTYKSGTKIVTYTNDKTAEKINKSDIDATKLLGIPNADINKKHQVVIRALQKIATNDQEIITTITSEYMSQFKFALAQSRKIWVSAAAWSSSVHKESVEYSQAVGESAAEQFYTNMEAIY